MAEQSVRLIYPPSLINSPVINQLIRKFDLNINILRAQISLEQGWIEIRMTGSAAILEDALHWLEEEGIEVRRLAGTE